MPYRKEFFAEGEFYHIFNRSLHIPIFKERQQAGIFLEGMKYYLNPNPPVKFSTYRRSRREHQIDLSNPLVKIIAYCLMPNHFHFILLQNTKRGIRSYIQKLTNSYAHYFNLRHGRSGPLFEGPFKAIRIETEEQLLHLSRYIHLNPVTGYLVEHPKDYPYSSFPAYLGKLGPLPVEVSIVLSFFSSPKEYERFVLARKDYQRKLEKIKHLLLE